MSAISSGSPSSAFNHSISPLQEWLNNAHDLEYIRDNLDNLKALPTNDLKFVLDFFKRNELLHNIIKMHQNKDYLIVIRELLTMGMDINALDSEGRSLLTYVTEPEIFKECRIIGANYTHPYKTIVDFLFSQNFKTKWLEVLKEEIATISVNDLLFGWKDILTPNPFNIIFLSYMNEGGTWTKAVLKRIADEKPQELATRIVGFICKWTIALKLIDDKIINEHLAEEIFTNGMMYADDLDESDIKHLTASWKPTGKLADIVKSCNNDLIIGLVCQSILKSKSLNEICRICDCNIINDRKKQIDNIDPELKRWLASHVEKLQRDEQRFVWHLAASFNPRNPLNLILVMEQFGFDPNTKDPQSGGSWLFHPKSLVLIEKITQDFLKQSKLDIHLLDNKGNNALEHHCQKRYNPIDSGIAIRVLIANGLTISDRFPGFSTPLSSSLFPDKPYCQVALAIILCQLSSDPDSSENPWEYDLLERIVGKDSIVFRERLVAESERQGSELEGVLQFLLKINIDPPRKTQLDGWMDRFDEEGRKKLMALETSDESTYRAIRKFIFNHVFNDKAIPFTGIALIPESPYVSWVISFIKWQQLNHSNDFFSMKDFNLNSNELLLMYRYLFDHPKDMGIIIQRYMRVNSIDIKTMGDSQATHADFVTALMQPFKELKHLSKDQRLPNWQKAHESLMDKVPPLVKEIEIPEGATLKQNWRTITVDEGSSKEAHSVTAFKFLKKGENYDHFSREYSVGLAFDKVKDQLKSDLIQPLGLYMVSKLPSSLMKYRDSMPIDPSPPYYVMHHVTKPETSQYISDLSPEEYIPARDKALHDTAKMILMGYYPDSSLTHNISAGRLYVVLIDLMSKLQPSAGLVFRGGAGRLDQPFSMLQHNNWRKSGLTDLGDATLSDGTLQPKNKIRFMYLENNISFFYQMHALSMLLFEDMLILAKRSIASGDLHWENDKQLEAFGLQLVHAFATVSAAYTGEDHTKFVHFYTESLRGSNTWKLASRQIAFWLDNSPKGYPAWLKRNAIPPGLYSARTEVTVDMTKAENFDPETGTFHSKGHQDIGPFNGPLGLTAYEEALYLLFMPILLKEETTVSGIKSTKA